VRIGEMGDPSMDWEHTLGVRHDIAVAGKPIVIVTKHWKPIPENLLGYLGELHTCVNTSVSALDNDEELEYRLQQFERIKPYCNSVLRVVSCDFNRDNADGFYRAIIQEELFKVGGSKCIDNIFRASANNHFVVKGIINTKRIGFMRSMILASVNNNSTYFGMCGDCPDMCGVNL